MPGKTCWSNLRYWTVINFFSVNDLKDNPDKSCVVYNTKGGPGWPDNPRRCWGWNIEVTSMKVNLRNCWVFMCQEISHGKYMLTRWLANWIKGWVWWEETTLASNVTWLKGCFSLCGLSSIQWRHNLVDEIFTASMLYVMKLFSDTPWLLRYGCFAFYLFDMLFLSQL